MIVVMVGAVGGMEVTGGGGGGCRERKGGCVAVVVMGVTRDGVVVVCVCES